MREITLKTVFSKNKEVINNKVDGEDIMMSVERSKYFGLNSVGSKIWELIDGKKNLESICLLLTKSYDVSKEMCEREVLNFAINLYDEGLIKVEERIEW